jgi:hypothetical protein
MGMCGEPDCPLCMSSSCLAGGPDQCALESDRFCSGQSNMELPMQHGLTRNRTYELLALGQYSNIRTFKQGTHRKLPDTSLADPSGAVWVLPPPAPPSCPLPDGTPTCYQGWQSPNASTVDEFSAACWFTAQELTDIAVDQGKPAPILGESEHFIQQPCTG